MGHDVVGLDLPDDAIAEASSILGVPYCPHRITYDDLLPPIFGYDLIAMFGVNFRDFNGDYWQAYHYDKLAYEVERRLRDGGRWVVRPNQDTSGEPRIAMLADLAWWQDIAGDGATITGTPNQVQIQWKR
jgi:hypothetical protein